MFSIKLSIDLFVLKLLFGIMVVCVGLEAWKSVVKCKEGK